MNITGKIKECIIIGDPVEHSLSPVMHNAAYRELGLEGQYVFKAERVKSGEVGKMVNRVRKEGVRGLTCTAPHKEEVMQYLDEIDPIAKKIGAVNTVVNDNGVLTGYNTDWLGTVMPLEKVTKLSGKKVALLGAGGAARAMAYGVVEKGAELKIYNRTVEKAKELASELGCRAGSLDEIREVKDCNIILNSTAVGMGERTGESLVPEKYLTDKHIVMDAVYVPLKTKLLTDAQLKGAQIILGTEMLLCQGVAQFELYTGEKAPEEVMRRAIEEPLLVCK
ncbi:MAG: shikimate dehydrogenase [Parcubacteria group bacterium]